MDARLERAVTHLPSAGHSRPLVVIIGARFGGLSAAIGLRRTEADITVIDRTNHHLFQPLLYQVATAGLSPADIAAPIRSILRAQTNTRVILGTVTGIDRERHVVTVGDHSIPYDYLVVATGARDAYFGHDEWAACTSSLKTIEDARVMRQRILRAFEHAEDSDDEAERQRLMTFAIIGGGPTGVELAGALAELSRATLARDFRRINPSGSSDLADRGRSATSFELSRATLLFCGQGASQTRRRVAIGHRCHGVRRARGCAGNGAGCGCHGHLGRWRCRVACRCVVECRTRSPRQSRGASGYDVARPS